MSTQKAVAAKEMIVYANGKECALAAVAIAEKRLNPYAFLTVRYVTDYTLGTRY